MDKLTDAELNGRSRSSFNAATNAAKSLIYLGQQSNVSSFTHELFHAVASIRKNESAGLSLAIHDTLNDEVRRAQFTSFINDHKEIWEKANDNSTVEDIVSRFEQIAGNKSSWAPKLEEDLARLWEAYASSSNSIRNSMPSEVCAIMQMLSDMIMKVYRTLRNGVALDPQIAEAYNRLMNLDGKAETSTTRSYDEVIRFAENRGKALRDYTAEEQERFFDYYTNKDLYDKDPDRNLYTHKDRGIQSDADKLEREIPMEKALSDAVPDMDVFILPEHIVGIDGLVVSEKTPDGFVNRTFMEMKKSNEGTETSVRNAVRKAKTQADILYIEVPSSPLTMSDIVRVINGQMNHNADKYEGKHIIISRNNKNLQIFDIEKGRLVNQSPLGGSILGDRTSRLVNNFTSNTGNVNNAHFLDNSEQLKIPGSNG
ncbi:MAG: hypothetical protein KBS81_11940 [Spirochaetales bacterium]|nr:hypothetical protein [Candidatus Physcosoma equi]